MLFARIVFIAAAVYGIAVVFPLYFSEQQFATQFPPALNHPEYFYSFTSVTLVWQALFVFIAFSPARYRALMLLGVLEKMCLLPTFFILNPQDRFPVLWIPLLIADLVFGVLFFTAFLKSKTKMNGHRPAPAGI
jgi:hypothetical protein